MRPGAGQADPSRPTAAQTGQRLDQPEILCRSPPSPPPSHVPIFSWLQVSASSWDSSKPTESLPRAEPWLHEHPLKMHTPQCFTASEGTCLPTVSATAPSRLRQGGRRHDWGLSPSQPDACVLCPPPTCALKTPTAYSVPQERGQLLRARFAPICRWTANCSIPTGGRGWEWHSLHQGPLGPILGSWVWEQGTMVKATPHLGSGRVTEP